MEKVNQIKEEIQITQEALEKAIKEYAKEQNKELLKEINSLKDKIAKLEKAAAEAKVEYPDFGKMSEGEVKELAVEYFKALGRQDYGKIKALTGGSNLVPAPVRAEIYEVATKYGVIRANAQIVDMSSDTLKLPTGSNDITLTDTSAGSSYVEKDVAINAVTLTAVKATGYIDIEEETLADANVSILNYIYDVFGRAVAKYEDNKAFNDATVGILANGTVHQLDTGKTTFASVTFDDLATVIALLEEGHDLNAKFYMHKSIVMELLKKKGSDDRYIMTPPGADVPGTIWNYPYVRSAVLPSTSTATQNDVAFMVYGDLKNFALGVREELSLRTLNEVAATDGKVRVLAKERVGMGLLNASDVIVIKTAAV